MSDDLTSVFRITASLKEPVRYSAVREAVEITSKRFPYFNVTLGNGIFWHFLEFNDIMPRIQAEEAIPCTAFASKRKGEPLYRIVIKGSRISVEFVHILTDGAGALEYLKSLLYTYLTIIGKQISHAGNIILPSGPLSEEEFEDGYNRFFQKLPPPSRMVKAWHLPFRLNKSPRLRLIRAEIDANEIRELAQKHKVTVTEYFVSVYHFALQKIFLSEKEKGKRVKRKVLRIEVPVNMRKIFPSRTMRNFSLFVLPEIDLRLGTYTFEEILKSVHHQLQIATDAKQISRLLSSNVSPEKLLAVRLMPLFIKKMVIASVYKGLASKRWSGIVTNLGMVDLPAEMADRVASFELVPPPPNLNVRVNCALVSFKRTLRICFCNVTQSHELERLILMHLSEAGIRVRIPGNEQNLMP